MIRPRLLCCLCLLLPAATRPLSALASTAAAPQPAAPASEAATKPPATAAPAATLAITEVKLAPKPATPTPPAPDAPEVKDPSTVAAEETRSLVRLGLKLTDRGEYVSGETALLSVLQNRSAARIDKRDAILALGRLFRRKGDLAKAAAVYEKFFKEFPADETAPGAYLDLGRTLRAMGSPQLAIARFYNVINSTLKLPENGFDTYRQLAKTAQFEIAETYFQSGDFAEASRYFSRLKLLDLAPIDRARAHFKAVYSLYLAQDNLAAATGLRSFLEQNPDDENVPEARYLLAVTLRRLNHLNEAYEVTIDLLRTQRARTSGDPKRWAYWQRRTGNQLANEYYEQGDYQSSLVIYQSLAEISPDPEWRLPVLYQVGLCQERLQQTDRARATYQSILDLMPRNPETGTPPSQVQDIVQMVAWRLKHLNWRLDTTAQTDEFFRTFPKTPAVTTAKPPAAHDPNGSAPSPPATL
ncbi:MAG: tetratricopeptide repeat protein [Opitutae bacterium]|nr:tetratricopeptide repeat protein [Opitutae bacterium]